MSDNASDIFPRHCSGKQIHGNYFSLLLGFFLLCLEFSGFHAEMIQHFR